MTTTAGPLNLITDVGGLRVGNAQDDRLKSGVTVVLCDTPAVAGVQVLGGAPGTRETDALETHNSVEAIHALTFAGGSAFGLDAASGVQAALREQGVGLQLRGNTIPIVPAAIVFDLANGGDKSWGRYPPYRELGHAAVGAAGRTFGLGSTGAGSGALTWRIKGGLGSASTVLPGGVTVGAVAVVNAVGSATVGVTRHFWAAPWEIGAEFGGLGLPAPIPDDARTVRLKYRDRVRLGENTTVAVVATDAVLTRPQAKRLAIAAHDGLARALWPAHTPADGDLVFSLSTGTSGTVPAADDMIDLCAAAASTMARAIARGVFHATPSPGDLFACWSSLG